MKIIEWFAKTSTPDPTIKISPKDLHLPNAPKTFDATSVQALLGTVYLVAGIVAVVAIVLGSIRFITANGDPGQVSSAKNVITYAVVGLVVVLMAAAITQFVITRVA